MIDAITYQEIVRSVHSDLDGSPKRLCFIDSIEPAQRRLMAEINSKLKKHALVVVLFCNPKTEFCKREILNSMNYFHHRSKEHINIFCCGHGAYWPKGKYPDLQSVTEIDGVQWSYSDKSFVSVVEEFESRTNWHYSGENEALVLDISPSENREELNINSAIVCNLEIMSRDGAFDSVRSFFESLIRYASSTDSADAWGFSDRQGYQAAKSFLKDSILNLLPSGLKAAYSKAESYAIRQI